ncbi:phytoene synthase [Robbsia andropogonis]
MASAEPHPPIAPLNDDAVAKARRSSFYMAMRVLPRAQRDAMYEIYRFCRAVDDLADDEGPWDARRAGLDLWRARIDALFPGTSPNAPAGTPDASALVPSGLRTATQQFSLQKDDFIAVIDGMQMDLDADIQAPSFAVLDLYCDRVASAVGRLSTQVFGLDRELGVALAHHLGRALQFTNILRDLDEDIAIHRLYLPREALVEAGIDTRVFDQANAVAPNWLGTASALSGSSAANDDARPTTPVTAPLRTTVTRDAAMAAVLQARDLPKACTWLARRAQTHYQSANALMRTAPRRTVKAPRLMYAVYHAIFMRTVQQGWAAPRTRVRLPSWRLVWLLLRHGLL